MTGRMPEGSRRDFLTGQSGRDVARRAGGAIADSIAAEQSPPVPTGGDTVRLETTAMACNFSVIMNPGPHDRVPIASAALERIHELEDQLTVYRDHSEVSRMNRTAADEPVTVEPRLFALLQLAEQISRDTDGAFDITSGPLIDLWRSCRAADRIPTEDEISDRLEQTGFDHIELNPTHQTIRFSRADMNVNLGGIGKGHALDQSAEILSAAGVEDWLLHGGHSSILARGDHNCQGGWPVGIGNPLFTNRRLGTILLRDQALATSGSNIQYFRHRGRRYGHILDPRTGWPAEGLLSATVLAPTAAMADAVSTAIFVLGVENARSCCDNLEAVGVILMPQPSQGRLLQPILIGIPDDTVFWDPEQVAPT